MVKKNGFSLTGVLIATGIGALIFGFIADMIIYQYKDQKHLSQKLEMTDFANTLIATFAKPGNCTCQFINNATNPNLANFGALHFDSTNVSGTESISVNKLFSGCLGGANPPILLAANNQPLHGSQDLIVDTVKLINLKPSGGGANPNDWQGQWQVIFKVASGSLNKPSPPVLVTQKFTIDPTVPTVASISSCNGISSGTGTTNFLAKWSGITGMLMDSGVYEDPVSRNIGIGMTAPTQQLEISKSLKMPPTTMNDIGVVYKGVNSFIHDFQAAGSTGANTFVGTNSGNFTMLVGAADNTAFGYVTLNAITSGQRNSGFGSKALGSVAAGNNNTAVGYLALGSNATGSGNTGIGSQALMNSNGAATNGNTAVGSASMLTNTTGSLNSSLGEASLLSNTTGMANAAFGRNAMWGNTNGWNNTGIGQGALLYNSTGNQNTAVGSDAAFGNVTTIISDTVAVGYRSGYSMTISQRNTLLGSMAGFNLTTGSNNILIGYNIQPSVSTVNNELNIGGAIYGNLATGYVGIGTATPIAPLHVLGNSLVQVGRFEGNHVDSTDVWIKNSAPGGRAYVLGSTGDANPILGGKFTIADATAGGTNRITIDSLGKVGIGTTAPRTELDLNAGTISGGFPGTHGGTTAPVCYDGTTGVMDACVSLKKFKKNIQPLDIGLDEILRLQPVTYELKSNGYKEIGFIAEDATRIDERFAQKSSLGKIVGVKYSQMVALLAKGIQQLHSVDNVLKKRIEELELESKALKTEMKTLKDYVCSKDPASSMCADNLNN